jgi:hypothetical protein
MEEKKEQLLSKKQLDNLIVVAYIGIVLGYGLLLYAKMKHSEK